MRSSEFVERALGIELSPWQAILINSKFVNAETVGPAEPIKDRGDNWESLAKATCGEKGLTVLGFEGGYVWVEDASESILPIRESTVAEWMVETQCFGYRLYISTIRNQTCRINNRR